MSIKVIKPYKFEGQWVFDDENVGLIKEELVGGADDLADLVAAQYPEAENGFRLDFSDQEFPGYMAKLNWVRSEIEGDSYVLEGTDQEVWLCPALLKYFEVAPENLYLKVDQ